METAIVRRFDLDVHVDWSYDISLAKLKEQIAKLEEAGATGIDICVEESYGSHYIRFQPFVEREETPDEVAERLAEMKQREAAKRAADLANLERLKNLYENSGQ